LRKPKIFDHNHFSFSFLFIFIFAFKPENLSYQETVSTKPRDFLLEVFACFNTISILRINMHDACFFKQQAKQANYIVRK